MIRKNNLAALALFFCFIPFLSFSQNAKWKKGILVDEFIFEQAPFPQSHASTIAETPDGLIAAWFGGTKEGYNDVCIWTSHLVNGKWTAPQMAADGVLNDSTRYACYNPVLYYAPNGELLLFYKIGPNVAGWTGWMKRSKDNGKTWEPREALPEGFLGPIKNKPELIDGTLICPSSTEKNGWKVHFEYTKDWGHTWTKSEDINDGTIVSAIQPSILKYKNGSLQVLCRSKNRTINESRSTDRGKTWSPMKATNLPNNNSGTDAVTLKDGRQLLVYNHVKPPADAKNGKGLRTPLNVAISKDGKTWYAVLVLEDSPVSQYSYPSVIQTKDGMVHIVYTWRRERIKHVMIDPSKLKMNKKNKIVNETWPGTKLEMVDKMSED
ncbi:MAG: exo-alpha-sialidase [Bacteroidetes bacterium]|nr:exo-alpha-sialidase [Bacteroidota bacterium]